LAEGEESLRQVRIRVQDLSVTGMSVYLGELEVAHFEKERNFKNVTISFVDEIIEVPEVRVVYVVDYISGDKNLKKYKVGFNFPNLSSKMDDVLSKKINKLLRENDFNKDFENFLK
jgi:hypothetical protein